MNGRNILSFSLLLIGAIGTWYLARTLTSDDIPVNKTEMVQNGFYLKSARIFGTAASGQLLYEIEAEYAEQLGKGQKRSGDSTRKRESLLISLSGPTR